MLRLSKEILPQQEGREEIEHALQEAKEEV